ncbi:ARF guanine-nucleotide exchange factor GNL2 isoform X2 [Prosopis cineraria]|uniref:ARF guanine-nucleotide exchange factor GNL2 isoform X2 n=1 Tax=Prosopis cineraria TaxID=364024 RepID=UPI00240F956E|nr:ARF guanine-nucleotide exchange factor GNL2 isoform X2 [Prosopis cineraria]
MTTGEEDRDKRRGSTRFKRKELGVSCMLSTEVGTVLALVRRPPDINSPYLPSDESYESAAVNSLRSLRSLIFNLHQEWRSVDPSIYLTPFLDVIQADDVPASATAVSLSSVLKILKLGIFDEHTPGAKDALDAVANGITSCRLEKTDPVSEDAVMMRILQVLTAIMSHRASFLFSDQAVCTIVNTCFQVVQQSANRGDLLQRTARYTMHELIQIVFSRLAQIEVKDGEESSESDTDDVGVLESGYGVRCAIDIFHFLCSLVNVMEVVETEGSNAHSADEDVQIFSLILINSAIELSGDAIGKHPRLMRMIQDDLFHHLIYYGTWSSSLVLSMICSTVLNAYHCLRRQPTFVVEAYANYDCDPLCRNVFEEIGKLLCKHSFAGNGPLTSLQIQAFEGLVIIIHNIADNIDKEDDSSALGPYSNHITEYTPFWEEKEKNDCKDLEAWVEHLRIRKLQKRKMLIAGNHYIRDDKKGLEYLKHAQLISDPPDPKAFAFFFHYTPGLDKNLIGEYLGDPDDFHLQVLREFAATFYFTGMALDTALRFYLETFRLPGESQKIQRVLEAFSERYYDHQSADIFASKDTVLILSYSLIMLNTDQHNPQVKKKMTEEDFIKNNRAINEGQDLPREFLSELYHSILSNPLLAPTSTNVDMNPSKWIQLINQSKVVQPFIQCDFDRRICRDMFACIAGPAVAALSTFFEHADEDDLLHECIEGLFSVARIAQYGLEDTLDELITSFCKFTTLQNPYASIDETLYVFSNDLKPRMATVAVFTVANNFGDSIKGGWKNIIDCLLKLKKLRLLPPSVIDLDLIPTQSVDGSSVNFPVHNSKLGSRQVSNIASHFSFSSRDGREDNLIVGTEFEQNVNMIRQCRIGNIFSKSSNIPEESLQNLGRSLIFAAAGKGQKFNTPIEEEETVGFCWDLITAITLVNVHRFQAFWPQFHEYFLMVAQFPIFSPIPFAEKAIASLFRISLRILSSLQADKLPEELIFKSINLMWMLDKEILDTCCGIISQSVIQLIYEYPGNLQAHLGWKTVLHLLSITGRHPETYDQSSEALISLMSDGVHFSRSNYSYCIDCAFSFIALRNSPLEKNLKILDLLSESVNLLIQWQRNQYSDPGSNFSGVSNASSSSIEENPRGGSSNFTMNLFVKLGEAFKKTSLARREEIRNYAVQSLRKSFDLAEELLFTSANYISCFNLVIFAMVDDLHEKMLEYSRRENSEREMRSMEGTLKISMELMTDVYLQFLKPISESNGFRTFWLGILRRMDTCMKADLGQYGTTTMQDLVPNLLRRIITRMKEKEILVPREDDDLWETTYFQIQWIAPALKDELFPD